MLAELVGATRPTVTTAFGRLAARDVLTREPSGGWMLSEHAGEALEPMPRQVRDGPAA